MTDTPDPVTTRPDACICACGYFTLATTEAHSCPACGGNALPGRLASNVTDPNDDFMRGYRVGYEAGQMAAEDDAERLRSHVEKLRRALENLLALLPHEPEKGSTP